MKTISVSEAKASLSAQIRYVNEGEEVVITDRGRPVARLVPIAPKQPSIELDDLERAGLIRRGSGELPGDFWSRQRPADPDASVRQAITDERNSTW